MWNRDDRGEKLKLTNHAMITGLFMTITNANFDGDALEKQIEKVLKLRDELSKGAMLNDLHDAATFQVSTSAEMKAKANSPEVGVLATENVDVRSLRELITYGLKGIAAYAEHALNIGKEEFKGRCFLCLKKRCLQRNRLRK